MSEAALAYVVQAGWEPAYGARPLRRWLEQHVVTDLSTMLIAGQLRDNSIVRASTGTTASPQVLGVAPSGGLVYTVEQKLLSAENSGSDAGGSEEGLSRLKRRLGEASQGDVAMTVEELDDDEM
jgi:ATP-dependent Clp protease ATP-binding subunit ClpB